MSRYELKPYRTPSDRLTCPSCGHRREFSPYIDAETGEILHPSVGRCNREKSCGYHYKPSEYFKDHPEREGLHRIVRASSSLFERRPEPSADYLPLSLIEGEITIYIGFSCPVSGRLSPTVFLTSTESERRSTSETPEDFPPLSPK